MAELFSISGLFTLGMLVLLQAVLGFDNLLYISIESKRVAEDQQSKVRKLGIGVAVVLRIVLLFVVVRLIALLEEPFVEFHNGYIDAAISGHSLIVMMNLVFSFDSILSAMALTKSFAIMATAIVISGAMMIFLADRVADFLKKNRMYEVLGLFVLFIVGVMLVSEGGHLAHVALFGHEVHPMAKSTFYFVLAILIVVDIVQAKYQKTLLARQDAATAHMPKKAEA